MFHKKKDKEKNKIAIYTSIIGEIDNLIEPDFDIPGCDLILFTNRKDIQSDVYDVRYWPDIYENERLSSRAPKLLPHFFLSDYEYSMWIDGRVVLRNEQLADFIKHAVSEKPWAVYSHPERDDLFEEAKLCKEIGKDSAEKIDKQIYRYKSEGYDNQEELVANTVIIRKHMNSDVAQFNEKWWLEIQNESIRDQLSFPYLAWKHKLEYEIIDGNIRKNKFLRILRYKQRDSFKKGEYKINEARN